METRTGHCRIKILTANYPQAALIGGLSISEKGRERDLLLAHHDMLHCRTTPVANGGTADMETIFQKVNRRGVFDQNVRNSVKTNEKWACCKNGGHPLKKKIY